LCFAVAFVASVASVALARAGGFILTYLLHLLIAAFIYCAPHIAFIVRLLYFVFIVFSVAI